MRHWLEKTSSCSVIYAHNFLLLNLLGFEASTSLDVMLDEVIPWIENAISNGTI